MTPRMITVTINMIRSQPFLSTLHVDKIWFITDQLGQRFLKILKHKMVRVDFHVIILAISGPIVIKCFRTAVIPACDAVITLSWPSIVSTSSTSFKAFATFMLYFISITVEASTVWFILLWVFVTGVFIFILALPSPAKPIRIISYRTAVIPALDAIINLSWPIIVSTSSTSIMAFTALMLYF